VREEKPKEVVSMNEIIHCRMSSEQLSLYGSKIGLSVKPDLDAHKYDHVCSWLIAYNVVELLGDICDLTKHSYTEITGSFSLMTKWVNLAKLSRCIKVSLDMWHNPKAEIIFDAAYLGSSMNDYPSRIHDDLCVVSAWIVIRGADGASVRRNMPSKVQSDIRKIVKAVGDDGIISTFWRSIVAFISITEKAIEPIYRECFKHGRKETANMVLMQSAFAQLKKSA
jgi:hypothetical protein